MVTIRRAVQDDFEVILALIKEFSVFQKTPERVTVTLEEMICGDLFQGFVAETVDKKIIGFASFFYTWYSWSGKAIYLDDLYVTQPYRKQAIGKKLLEAVIDLAKKEGCKKVRWQVSDWNTNAIAFYKKTGASIDKTEVNCDLVIEPAKNDE